MSSVASNVILLLGTGAVVFGLSLLIRHRFPRLAAVDPGPWSSTLSYVATAYGVVIGFSILLQFGQFAAARQAVGDEATSIGTAFEEIRLFDEDAPAVQGALICYADAVADREWPAMRDRGSAPEVDRAYRAIIGSLGAVDQPADRTFQPATATNIVAQVGSISTARETRLVAAELRLPPLLWVLLVGGGAFVVAMVFVVTLPATPRTQAVLVSLSAMFTVVMVVIVVALSTPFASGSGRISPELIRETAATMRDSAPAAAELPCAYLDAN